MSEFNRKEAFAPIYRLTIILILFFVIILFFSLIVSVLLSKTIINPITKIHQGSEEIIEGNLDYKIGIKQKDEIGQLSRAFDEMTLNLKKSKEKIEKDLKIKTALLQELYHRTKNNMAVISSMLSMQSRRSDNEFVITTFNEISNKIRAMSLVHNKLYKAKDLSNINLKEYIEDLTKLIMQSYGKLSERINIRFDMQEVKILIDSAIPLGLIINELITNVFKHAFTDNQEGEIVIKLQKEKDETINLLLRDNGIGFPQNFDPRKDGSMGLTTVFSIVEHQLKGKISVVSKNGLKWHIKLKDNLNKARI